jgi:hypothetical protein
MAVFTYKPLKGTPHSFRLLLLNPGQFHSPISGKIIEYSLDDRPEYESVSYVWGTASERESISLDDKYIAVTASLATALQYLRHTDRVRLLWIDQLCINQQDLVERGEQVRRMSRIYQNASRNVVWLGEADDSSRIAFSWFQKMARDLASSSQIDNDPISESSRISKNLAHIDNKSLQRKEWEAVTATFRSCAVWSRVWIIQEFTFVRDLVFICGSDSIAWSDVQSVVEMASQDTNMESLLYTLVSYCLGTVLFMKEFRRKMSNKSFKDLLFTAQGWKATDEKDHVYALIALSRNMESRIVPDYTKSVQEIFISTTIAVIAHDGDLNIICRDQIQLTEGEPMESHTLPSWVPYFGRIEMLLDNPSENVYNASSGSPKLHAKFSRGRLTLSANGQHVDYLERLWDKVPVEGWAGNLWHGNVFLSLPHDWESFSYNRDWFESGDGDVVWRAILTDKTSRSARLSAQDVPRYRKQFMDWFGEIITTPQGIIPNPTVSDFTMALALLCRGRRMALTWGNRLVSVPWNAQVGDEICVLHSATVPTLMRPVDGHGGVCTLVGTAYIQGLMDGEAMADTKQESIQ